TPTVANPRVDRVVRQNVILSLDAQAEAHGCARGMAGFALITRFAAGSAEGEPKVTTDEQLGNQLAADVEDDGDLPGADVRKLPALERIPHGDGVARADIHLKAGPRLWRLLSQRCARPPHEPHHSQRDNPEFHRSERRRFVPKRQTYCSTH